MLNRRGFLGGLFSAIAAPAIVKAENLMPIFVPKLIVPSLELFGDGITDDTTALNHLLAGGSVMYKDSFLKAQDGTIYLPTGSYLVESSLVINRNSVSVDGLGSRIITCHDKPAIHVAARVKGVKISNMNFQGHPNKSKNSSYNVFNKSHGRFV
jgi:Pectate lyase superfamily protein